MKEIWADIEGYEGKYKVSTWGRVANGERIVSQWINHKGYSKVTLYKGNDKKNFRVNRLVAQAFIPNWLNYPEVNHKDGNKRNNSITNLEWVTGQQNREYDKVAEIKTQRNIEFAKLMVLMRGCQERGVKCSQEE